MALHSLFWERQWRVASGEPCPIGWQLLDSTDNPVGKILDLLADDRTRQVVYAVAEIADGPLVLVDMDRLSLDDRKHQIKTTLHHASLKAQSPANWWRRPSARPSPPEPVVRSGAAETAGVPVPSPAAGAIVTAAVVEPPEIVAEGPAGPIILPEVERVPTAGDELPGPGDERRAA